MLLDTSNYPVFQIRFPDQIFRVGPFVAIKDRKVAIFYDRKWTVPWIGLVPLCTCVMLLVLFSLPLSSSSTIVFVALPVTAVLFIICMSMETIRRASVLCPICFIWNSYFIHFHWLCFAFLWYARILVRLATDSKYWWSCSSKRTDHSSTTSMVWSMLRVRIGVLVPAPAKNGYLQSLSLLFKKISLYGFCRFQCR